jgi:hypothetical protein
MEYSFRKPNEALVISFNDFIVLFSSPLTIIVYTLCVLGYALRFL